MPSYSSAPPPHAKWAQKHVALSTCKASVITVGVQPKLKGEDNMINPTPYNVIKISSTALKLYVYGRTEGQTDADDLTYTFSQTFVSSRRNLGILKKYSFIIYTYLDMLFFCIPSSRFSLKFFPPISLCSTFIYSSVLSIKGGGKVAPLNSTKTYGGEEVLLHSLRTLTLHGSHWAALSPDRLIPVRTAPAVIE